MPNENMIKALRCLGSNSPEGDCYMDFFNFNNQNEILNDKIKPMTCGNRTNDPKYQQCPYYQDEFETCFEDGECDWLKDTAELIEQQQAEITKLKQQLDEAMELLNSATKDIEFLGDHFGCAGCDNLKPDWSDKTGDWHDCPFASDAKDECRENWKYQDRYERLRKEVEDDK